MVAMVAILGFPIGTILAIFDLQVTLMLPSKSIGIWVKKKKQTRAFEDGHGDHLEFSIGTISAIFIYKSP